MSTLSTALGAQPYEVIANTLHAIGDHEAAGVYEQLQEEEHLEESFFQPPRRWLNTEYQYGFLEEDSTSSTINIVPAQSIQPDRTLINRRINIRLDWLYAYEYPASLFERLGIGEDLHTILFSFEAQNQVISGKEHEKELVSFNLMCKAKTHQSAAITGLPIFIGLTVGKDGIKLRGQTLNVSNIGDQKLINTVNSQPMQLGLSLLTTAQPALKPFVSIAQGIVTFVASKTDNVVVHDFTLGLDFEKSSSGIGLREGTYIVVQVTRPGELNWKDWVYNAQTRCIEKANQQPNETLPLARNALMLRISKYSNA